MTERLEYLDREYLSDYEYMEVDSVIKEQKPFDKMVRIETEYPVNEEDDNNKSYFSYNLALESSTDKELCMAIDVLDYALLGAPGAPVRQALIDAGLGEDVYGNFEDGIKQPFYSIVAKNVDGDREEEFLKVIKDTLKDLVKNGLNRQTLLPQSIPMNLSIGKLISDVFLKDLCTDWICLTHGYTMMTRYLTHWH